MLVKEKIKGKKTGHSEFWPPFSWAVGFWFAFIQVEAGKGLEMRKLVLSGFLASEEIYINQLEALLLVSICSEASGLPVRQCHDLKLLLEFERKEGLDQSSGPCTLWYCFAYSLASGSQGHCQKRTVPLSANSLLTVLGKAGEAAQPGWGRQTLYHLWPWCRHYLWICPRWGTSHCLHTELWESLSICQSSWDLFVIPGCGPSFFLEPFAPSQGTVAGSVRWEAVCAAWRHATVLRYQTNPSCLWRCLSFLSKMETLL